MHRDGRTDRLTVAVAVCMPLPWCTVAAAPFPVASLRTVALASDLINRQPDRFLFGNDDVALPDQEIYLTNLRKGVR
jgi:hypothetical protein